MKVLYQKNIPKSRQTSAVTGVVFSLSWESVVDAISVYRKAVGYDRLDIIKDGEVAKIHVSDGGITFVVDPC